MKTLDIRGVAIGNDAPLTLIAGPCQLESLDHALMIAREMKQACATAGANYVFKASYDKANRTAVTSYRGPGLDDGLKVLAEIKKEFKIPILSDVHRISEIPVSYTHLRAHETRR